MQCDFNIVDLLSLRFHLTICKFSLSFGVNIFEIHTNWSARLTLVSGPSANVDVDGAFGRKDGAVIGNQQQSCYCRAHTVQQVVNIPQYLFIDDVKCIQCFDAVGWAAGRASSL